jgi:glucokinase
VKTIAIGTDIGGSHISCAAVDFQSQSIIRESRANQAVNNQASAEEILKNWAVALSKSIAKIDRTQLVGIGFAMPGPFDYAAGIALFTKGVVKYQNLYGINVSERIRELLALPAGLDLRYMNDATAFGVGEAWLGEASGVNRSISITLGTGLGSAFIDNGIPVVEGDLVPRTGALWHLPFEHDIADASFSTRWFIKRYSEISGNALASVRELAERATIDSLAKSVFVEFGKNLADFLGPWIKKFAPELLVIGGNVSGAYNLFGISLEESLKQQQIATPVHVSKLKEDAASIGGARLFEEDFWNQIRPLLSKM